MKRRITAAFCVLFLFVQSACGTVETTEDNNNDRNITGPLDNRRDTDTEPPAADIRTPEPGYDRLKPAPIGVEQTITDSYKGYKISVKINSATRGEDAWKMISEANQFNESPDEGEEYIVVSATVTALSGSKDAAYAVNSYWDFNAFSSTNTQYEMPLIVDPKPELSGDIYEGGSITGNFTLKVRTDDPAPKIAYLRDYDGSGGIWFSLK
jgi:hypothetical protein